MEDLTGKQFGPYEIREPLGEGGMAVVYKAYQPSMNRFVAIKVLPRQMARLAEFTARFKREAHLLAQLQHPHILPVFDYGQSDEYTYLVMPLMQNGTLSNLMETRRLTLPEIRQIISQVGDALGYAHARGMIHRDIKPSNVLLDERGNCLLTDFGLARMAEATSQLTSSGALIGTPAYMSPEQGSSANVDGRSDLYSLGVVLYEMVTGKPPFSANTPLAVIFKHILDPLPSPRELAPDLSPALEQVITKVLAKKPDERYQSAEEFVKAVQRAIPLTDTGKMPPPAPQAQATRVSLPSAAPATVVSMPRQPRPAAPVEKPARSYQQPAHAYTPVSSQPSPQPAVSVSSPPVRRNFLPWAVGGVGIIIAACVLGAMFLVLGTYAYGGNFLLAAPPTSILEVSSTATATPRPIPSPAATVALVVRPTQAPTVTLSKPPTVAVPPNTKFVRINAITINDQKQYVVDYQTFEFIETLSGNHVHFFFNTVSAANAGMPGNGPWQLFGGPGPFTSYGTNNRPANASAMCALVANSNHSVIAKSGNCFPLPDVPTVTARVDTACLKTPTEVGTTLVTFKAGASSLLKGFSSDKTWLLIENPVAMDGTICWVPINSSLQAGDTSGVPTVNP